MSNLVELFDNVVEFQNYNGVPLAAGKLYVFALGRTRLMDTWSDVDGESLNPNPIILDDLGQCHCYCSDDFDYTLVVCDQFDNEIFSVDKYLLSKGEHSHADVAVAPSEHIGVSSYHVGEVTVYVPYLTGEVGKTYEGIDPIVVNNTVNRISANHIPLGVQDPLYFVEDSETACIIGLSGETIPEGVMSESALGFDNNKITGYNGSAFSAGNEYEAGSYVDIDNNTISVTGLQPEGDYAYNSALSSKLDVTALPQDLVHSGDLTAYYPIDNPSGFITGVDLTDYATTAQLDEKLDKTDSGNFYPMTGNPSGFLTAHQSLQGYATEQWVEDKGYITGVDIQESAGWNEAATVVNNNSAIWNNTTNVVSSNSAQWGASNPQIPVTGINGIKISESGDKVVFEVSADYYPGNNPSGFITGVDLSDYATTAELQTVSGEITALIPTALTGDYVEGNNESGFTIASTSGSVIVGENEYLGSQAVGIVKNNSGIWLSPNQLEIYGNGVDEILNANDISALKQLSSEKADITALTAYQPAGDYLTAVPDTYLQNTDLTIAAGKVIEISGIPLATGVTYTSPSGTILIRGNKLEASNSAVATVGSEGFVSSFENKTIGPENTPGAIANFSWDESSPNTMFNFDIEWNIHDGIKVIYSANTNLTGEIILPIGASTQSIAVPNATALDICTNEQWIAIRNNVASAADTVETVLGELAWASALPTYEYDSTNKISAINGSAIGGITYTTGSI